MKIILPVAGLFLALSACTRQDESQRVAQSFVDEHYVTIDLAAAKQFTTGLATKKVEEEENLVRGQVIDEGTAKPNVHYKLLERRAEGDDRVSFLFEGEARVEDSDVFTRKWLVTVKRDDDAWKVSNFHEFD